MYPDSTVKLMSEAACRQIEGPQAERVVFARRRTVNPRSAKACEWNIESITAGKMARMWTFTFRDVLTVKEASRRWSEFSKAAVRVCGFKGVRVFELHPGGHGLHVHVIVGSFYWVRKIRGLASFYGLGRVHVQRQGGAAKYVTKYLWKAARDASLRGVRIWDTIGFTASDVLHRTKDIVLSSPVSRIIKSLTMADVVCAMGPRAWNATRRMVQFYKCMIAVRSWRQPGFFFGGLYVSLSEICDTGYRRGGLRLLSTPAPDLFCSEAYT